MSNLLLKGVPIKFVVIPQPIINCILGKYSGNLVRGYQGNELFILFSLFLKGHRAY
jgi:hypothetical protein